MLSDTAECVLILIIRRVEIRCETFYVVPPVKQFHWNIKSPEGTTNPADSVIFWRYGHREVVESKCEDRKWGEEEDEEDGEGGSFILDQDKTWICR